MNTKLYLAYGSNMDICQMVYRCPDAEIVGRSEIKGWCLLFKGSKTGSYATIEPYEGGRVPVLVWRISQWDEVNLDIYEGYPRFYRKEYIPVILDGRKAMAMAYVMDESRPFGIPSARYYDVIEKAYERFGFDEAILQEALKTSAGIVLNQRLLKAEK